MYQVDWKLSNTTMTVVTASNQKLQPSTSHLLGTRFTSYSVKVVSHDSAIANCLE